MNIAQAAVDPRRGIEVAIVNTYRRCAAAAEARGDVEGAERAHDALDARLADNSRLGVTVESDDDGTGFVVYPDAYLAYPDDSGLPLEDSAFAFVGSPTSAVTLATALIEWAITTGLHVDPDSQPNGLVVDHMPSGGITSKPVTDGLRALKRR